MTYLDTHVVIWLYEGDSAKLSRAATERIRSDQLLVSPAVILELQFLREIQRLTKTGSHMVNTLAEDIGLSVCELPFQAVVESALDQSWVRDPFDRLIVAHADANNAALVTRDERIRRHYKRAVW